MTPQAPPEAQPKSEGSLTDGGGGGAVGDGGDGGTGQGSGAGSGIDPRISARRTAVLREQGRRRFRVAIIVLASVACLVGTWFVLHTPLFSARSVTVTGNVHETAAQIVAQAGLATRPPLLDVDAGAAAARVERLPWVRSAAVHVSWPDGVHIAVTEQTPRFVVGTPGGTWDWLNGDGRVLGASAARPPGLLLLNVPQAPGSPGTVLSSKDAAGLRVAATLPTSFAAQVTAVTVEPAGWVQLALTTPIVVDLGSASQLSAKYEDVSSILAGATLHNGDVIDVSVPDAPTVSMG
jgi:cell division protein FtsQ